LDKNERKVIISEIESIVKEIDTFNKKGPKHEQELYDTITRLQLKCYNLRSDIWSEWKKAGHIESYYPPITKGVSK
jgi:hypothetical protein